MGSWVSSSTRGQTSRSKQVRIVRVTVMNLHFSMTSICNSDGIVLGTEPYGYNPTPWLLWNSVFHFVPDTTAMLSILSCEDTWKIYRRFKDNHILHLAITGTNFTENICANKVKLRSVEVFNISDICSIIILKSEGNWVFYMLATIFVMVCCCCTVFVVSNSNNARDALIAYLSGSSYKVSNRTWQQIIVCINFAIYI
jgi:hypothetical protein